MKLLSKLIEEKIELLEKGRAKLEQAGFEKAEQTSLYEKTLAKTIMRLKNGEELELEGEKIKEPPTTILEKIARGLCYQEKMNADLAETNYRSIIIKIQAIESELNAYQSLYKTQIEV
jgi:translation elongation factor P/translation initiation factor 5A